MFRIYRNLHQGDKFSIQEGGRVIERLTDFTAHNVSFRVGQAGRQRVLRERRKNVHAFVVAESFSHGAPDVSMLRAVTYNPYLNDTFMYDGEPILKGDAVVFHAGRCYLL